MRHFKKIIASVLIIMFVFTIYGFRIPQARAAIAFDATSNSGAQTISDGFSWTHTVTGTNPLLVVGVGGRDSIDSADCDATGVTFNAVALVKIRGESRAVATGGVGITSLWYLTNPTTGSALTIEVTLGGGGTCTTVGAGAMSFTGINQSNALDADNGTTGSSAEASVVVTTVADNAWVVDVMYTSEAAISNIAAGDGQTERYEIDLSSENLTGSHEGPKTPAGNVTMSWTWTGTEDWIISAASFKPAAEAATDRNPPFHGIIQDSEFKIEDSQVWIIT